AADHLQPLGAVDDLRGRLGGGADRKAVIVADDLGELVLVLAEIRLEIDFDAAVPEDLDGGRRKRTGNKDFGFGHVIVSFALPCRGRVGAKRRCGVKLSMQNSCARRVGEHPTPPHLSGASPSPFQERVKLKPPWATVPWLQ